MIRERVERVRDFRRVVFGIGRDPERLQPTSAKRIVEEKTVKISSEAFSVGRERSIRFRGVVDRGKKRSG